MVCWIQILALCFYSGSKHLVRIKIHMKEVTRREKQWFMRDFISLNKGNGLSNRSGLHYNEKNRIYNLFYWKVSINYYQK